MEIDILARKATSSGARAEEMALARRTARLRREEIQRRDDALRSAERSAESAQQEINRLRAGLEREQRAREQAERDGALANEQNATSTATPPRTLFSIVPLHDPALWGAERRTVQAGRQPAPCRLARFKNRKRVDRNSSLVATDNESATDVDTVAAAAPACAVIVAEPFATADTSPAALTVATTGLLDDQVRVGDAMVPPF